MSTQSSLPRSFERAVRDLSRTFTLEPDAALLALLESGGRALRADSASLWMLEDAPDRAVRRGAWSKAGGIEDGDAAGPALDAGRIAALRERCVVEDPAPGAGLEAAVWSGGGVAGWVRMERPEGGWSAEERVFAATLADRASLALEREARLRAERTLRERERQVEEVETLTRLGSWDWHLPSDRITWSREQLRIHGLDEASGPHDFAGFLASVHPDDRARIVEECDRLRRTGAPFSFEYRIVRPDGAERLLHALGQLLPDESGGLVRMVGTSHDVTDARRTEEALRESEESYRTLFHHSSDAIFVHDVRTGAVLDANSAACALSGATPEQLHTAALSIIANGPPPFTPERAREYLHRAATGEPQRFEWMSFHVETGEEMWVEVSLQRVNIRGVDRLLALARDIRERRETERALRESEESYRTLFHHSSDAIWVHDLETGAFLDVNQRACEMYGYPVEEAKEIGVAGLSWGEPPFTPGEAQEFLRRAAAGEPQRFEWLGRHRDGSPVWGEVQLRRVTILGEDRILATARDIADRKRTDELLRRQTEELEAHVAERTAELAASNEALEEEVVEHEAAKQELMERTQELEGIFQALPDLYFRMRGDGTVEEFRAGAHVLAVPPSEFLGRRIQEMLPPDVGERVVEVMEEVRSTGGLVCMEYALPLDVGLREFEGRLLPLGDGRVIAVVRDITERKEAERALQAREEHFRGLIENAHDIICILDPDGVMAYLSPPTQRILGFAPEALTGRLAFEYIHPDDQAMVASVLGRILQEPGFTGHAEYRFLAADGSWCRLEAFGRLLNPDDPAAGVVVNARDVTERKAAEEGLARAKEEAESANRAKSEFLSRMSHELRTPLNSILGFAQVLDRAGLPSEQHKSLHHILRAGRHLLQLINEVLEIARIESGRQSLSLEPVRIGAVLQEAVGLVRPLAEQWRVSVDDAPREHADVYVRADRQRLTQVLLNLLSNAIKYNRPGGSVRLECVSVPEAEGASPRLAVRVVDTGRGIPSDRTEQLFVPFARLGAEQTEIEGTGLGLALSQRLTEAMDGSLALEWSGPKGSVFRLELRTADDPLERVDDARRTAAEEEFPHAPATLLYVEDNLANLSLVETILLSRPGWRTMSALQGQLGVELAREHLPDLVLLDLHLPDISGEEVLRRLRADGRTARIPVVVISADATPTMVQRLRTAGADAYLTKPLDIDEFLETVERFLPHRRTPR